MSPQKQRSNIWTKEELAFFNKVKKPELIQAFLDSIPYSSDKFARSPRSVIKDRRAHCFDGSMLAATALRMAGEKPIVVNLRAVRDDDHVITIFKRNGCIGAIAKSNYVGLRFREPIFKTLRELVLSYFEQFYNTEGEKTLRAYSVPFDLSRLDHLNWMFENEHLDEVGDRLDALRHTKIITDKMIKSLNLVDERSYKAGMLGVNLKGLYYPDKQE